MLTEYFYLPRGCGCPIPGGVQGQVGWGPGQPDLVSDVEVGGPACSRRVGAWWSLRSFPTQAILWYYNLGKSALNFLFCTEILYRGLEFPQECIIHKLFASHLTRHPKCHLCEWGERNSYHRSNHFSAFYCLVHLQTPTPDISNWDPVESHGSWHLFLFWKELNPASPAMRSATTIAAFADYHIKSPELLYQMENLQHCKLKDN